MLLLSLLALAATPPTEDEAHRRDRTQTEHLNRDAGAATRRRLEENARLRASYQDARAAWARDMARWRVRVADCRAGDRDACRE